MNEIKRMLRELQMLLCRKLNIDNTNAKYSDYNENYNKIIFVDPVTKKWSLGDSTEGNSNTTIPDYNPDNVYNEEDLFYYNSDDYEKNLTYVSGIYKSLINENKNFNSWEEYEVPPYIEATYSEYKIEGVKYWYAPDVDINIGDNILLKPSQDIIERGTPSFLILNCPQNILAGEFPPIFINISIPVFENIEYFLDSIYDCEYNINNNILELYFKDGIFYKLISCPVSDFGATIPIIENSELLADVNSLPVLLQYDYGTENITNNDDNSIIFDANSFGQIFNEEGKYVITLNDNYKNISTYSSEETLTNSVHKYLNESNVLVSKPIYRRVVEFTTTTGNENVAATGFSDYSIFSINGIVKNGSLLSKLGTRTVGSIGSDDYIIYNYDAYVLSNNLYVTASAIRPKNTPSLVTEFLPEIDFLITIEYTKISDPETIV